MRLFPTRTAAPLCLALALIGSLGVTSARAQGYNETMSALSAQSFYDDVQRRISAGTSSDDAPFYTSGYYPETPEQQAALEASERDLEIMRQLRADPRFERFATGWWEFYQAREPAEPARSCGSASTVNGAGSGGGGRRDAAPRPGASW